MLKSIFIILVSVIGVPIYAVCVIILYAFGAIFGISYVDSSVYICEYVQPLFTALVAIVFMSLALIKLPTVFRNKIWLKAALLTLFCLAYLSITVECVMDFCGRLRTYANMSNRQIFDYVVNKLRVMGEVYPHKSINLINGESIGFGYIMANMEVYILPLSLVLLLAFLQHRLTKLPHTHPIIQNQLNET